MSVHRAERTIEVDASPEACFAAAIDYETFPTWQSAVLAAEVLERDDKGRGVLVDFRTDAKLREVRYLLRYRYGEGHAVSWEYVEGDIEHIEGDYAFEQRDGGTRVTYRLGIDPGVPAPKFVVRRLNEQVMQRSMEDLKREVERRSARPD